MAAADDLKRMIADATRIVGFSSSRDFAGVTRSTRFTSDRPNAWIRFESTLPSGNHSRVPAATPSALWQALHPAFTSAG